MRAVSRLHIMTFTDYVFFIGNAQRFLIMTFLELALKERHHQIWQLEIS